MSDPTPTSKRAPQPTTDGADRHRRGVDLMNRIQGPDGGQKIRDGLAAISPEYGRYVIEAFADVYDRPGLTLAQRQLINVAVLTALGGAENQLAVHVRGALNVGLSPTEILETMFHVALYAGHPRTGNGLQVAAQVFAERGIDPTTQQPGPDPDPRDEA